MKLLPKTALAALLGLLMLGSAPAARAQVRVGVQLGAPGWGPQVGPNMQYYYIPELNAYYDLYNQAYLFFDGYNWISSYALPPTYAGLDPYQFHPVPLAYVGPQPWLYVQQYPQCVAPYRRYYRQPRVVVVQPYQGRRGGYGYGYGYGRGYSNGYGGHNGYYQQGYYNQGYQQPGRGYDRDERRRDERREDNRRNDAYQPVPGQIPGQSREDNDGRQGRFQGGEANRGGSYGGRGRVR